MSEKNVLAVFEEIGRAEASMPEARAVVPIRHGITFVALDPAGPIELMGWYSQGPIPLPAVGDVIGLHWDRVRVVAVHTQYGRDEGTGEPVVFTSVDVEALPTTAA
ncbi:hypothetical protein [Kitasatospora fiedleri]|uniref:hypothetical protein n=1 Tax=Kitasatospora fiedleri TaxID=2991545 RepID=UPI00249CB877|nr:hypothetical protein [Kitasatospora fiedleri]